MSSFCDLKKNDLLRFHHIFLFGKSNPLIFQKCFIRRTIAYLCLNIINFDAVDFSERRSEEVSFEAQCKKHTCAKNALVINTLWYYYFFVTGTWQMIWRKMKRMPSTIFFHGRLVETGGIPIQVSFEGGTNF